MAAGSGSGSGSVWDRSWVELARNGVECGSLEPGKWKWRRYSFYTLLALSRSEHAMVLIICIRNLIQLSNVNGLAAGRVQLRSGS